MDEDAERDPESPGEIAERREFVGELDADLSEGKQFTAGRLIQAIEDDPYDLDIPTEPPETRYVFGELF